MSGGCLIGELERVTEKEKLKEEIVPDENIISSLPKIPTVLDNEDFEIKQELRKQKDEINEEIDLTRLKDEIDAGEILKESDFYFGRENDNFFFMWSRLGLNKDNENFTDFLSSDISMQIFRENMFSIHIETGNIFYDNYNKNKSIYSFLLNQQDETKQVIHATLTYKDSFSNYLKHFLDDADNKTVEKLDFAHKNVKDLFYKFNDYLLFNGLNTVPVRHSKINENEIVMEEIQNKDWKYLVESVIKLAENNKSRLEPLPKAERKIIKRMKIITGSFEECIHQHTLT